MGSSDQATAHAPAAVTASAKLFVPSANAKSNAPFWAEA